MKKFTVDVQSEIYVYSSVEVEAETEEAATAAVEAMHVDDFAWCQGSEMAETFDISQVTEEVAV